MASERIPYTESSKLGPKFRAALSGLVETRKNLNELRRILDKYMDDTAAIATDSGLPGGSVALVRNLVTQAANELAGLASTQVNVGAATGCRQLADAMG
jgi:hypothetical protein